MLLVCRPSSWEVVILKAAIYFVVIYSKVEYDETVMGKGYSLAHTYRVVCTVKYAVQRGGRQPPGVRGVELSPKTYKTEKETNMGTGMLLLYFR